MQLPDLHSRSKEYRAYIRMMHRCLNPDYAGYHNYGGRGIRVCQRWQDSFWHFLDDVGKAPSADHSIDRQENNGHYSCGRCTECVARGWPKNLRWATAETQGNNRRTNVLLTCRGLTMTMAQWARFIGVSRKVIWKRVKLGWQIEDVMQPWPMQTEGRAA